MEANFSSPQPVLLVLGELHNPISDHEMNKSSPALRRARRRPPLSLPLRGDHIWICHVYPSTTLSSGGKRGGDRCLGVWTRGVSALGRVSVSGVSLTLCAGLSVRELGVSWWRRGRGGLLLSGGSGRLRRPPRTCGVKFCSATCSHAGTKHGVWTSTSDGEISVSLNTKAVKPGIQREVRGQCAGCGVARGE